MTREFKITPIKTYATIENARKAVAKAGDENVGHFYMTTEDGRYFPIFRPSEDEMANFGVHFRWNCI